MGTGGDRLFLVGVISADGKPLKRAFVQFVLDPIYQIFDAVMNEKQAVLDKMLPALNIVLKPEEKNQPAKRVLKAIMQKFLPASDALLRMIVVHLPSPAVSQRYRADQLYRGPKDDRVSAESCLPPPPPSFPVLIPIFGVML